MKYTFITLLLFLSLGAFANLITIQEAQRTAKNIYSEKSGIKQSKIVFEKIYTHESKGIADYYIFDVKGDNGFIIVSAEDAYFPIIGYSTTGKYVNENQPENIKWWMNAYVKQIDYLRKNNITAPEKVKNNWKKYNVDYKVFIPKKNGKSVDPLVGDILWNQDAGWNEFCPEDAAGPGGYVYAGCVATAMGIILKYHGYPIHGTGSHSYYTSYGTLSADYANANYFWNLMDNTSPNQYSAQLLYHLGVSVNMNYNADGSGAYSQDVPGALNNYFKYNNALYKDKGDYSSSDWINLIKNQINVSHPVYYSGRDDDNGGHAFVCSGYDDDDNFHFNFGWSGSNNGFYSLTDVGGFHNWQAAVINIYPSSTATYNAPQNFTAILDESNTSDFLVDLSWDAPAAKSLTGYKIYRDMDEIASLAVSDHTFTDNPVSPQSYDYSVRAIYSDGESFVASEHVKGEFEITFNFVNTGGSPVTMVTATLSNGGTYSNEIYTSFLSSAKYTSVLWGGGFSLEANHSSYTTANDNIPFNNKDVTYTFVMEQGLVSTDALSKINFNLYPNPSKGIININIEEANNSLVIVYDLLGKEVFRLSNLKQGENILIFTNLNKGLYILKYLSSNKLLASKSFIIE